MTDTGSAAVAGLENIISGTDGDDTISGTGAADTIDGAGGNDTITGEAGDDVIDGGSGQDMLFGGAGDDTLKTSEYATSDRFDGGDDTDTLLATGSVSLFGATLTSIETLAFTDSGSGLPSDILIPYAMLIGAGVTTLQGSAGADRLQMFVDTGGTYTIPDLALTNWILGDNFVDFFDFVSLTSITGEAVTLNARDDFGSLQALFGGGGNDTLNGSNGSDVLNGGAGVNVLNGNGGDDFLSIINAVPFFGGATEPTALTGAGSVYDGGAGFDIFDAGGVVDFQGTLRNFEAINLAAASGSAGSPGAIADTVLTISQANITTLPAGFTLMGTGTIKIDVTAGQDLDLSSVRFAEGSTIAVGIDGTAHGEVLTGTSGSDSIKGAAGNDTINGGAGADFLVGGDGHDSINGGDGNDALQGGFFANPGGGFGFTPESDFAGNDAFIGGAGFDNVAFNSGSVGVTVDLRIVGAQDTGYGMDSFESVEVIVGTSFSDTLIGDDGVNWLHGSTDFSFSGHNNDTLSGFGGGDNLLIGNGNHSVDGGDQSDYLSLVFSNDTGTTVVSLLEQGTVQDIGIGTLLLSNVENLAGWLDGETLIGDDNANILLGNGGNDTLIGNGGDDTLRGDSMVSLDENGLIIVDGFGIGDDTLRGGDGADSLFGEAGNDSLFGDAGADYLDGGEGDDIVNGGGGNDVMIAGPGLDVLNGGDGLDTVRFSGSLDDIQALASDLGGGDLTVGDTRIEETEFFEFALTSGTFLWDGDSFESAVTSGTVADGYVAGARVFIDANGNRALDSGEPSTITDANGDFSLASHVPGTIVAIGGTNIDTGQPNSLTLAAPAGSTVVNPLTSIVVELVDGGQSVADAQQQVKTAFGLDPAIDLTQTDLIQAAATDPAALKAQKAAASVAELLDQIVGAGGGEAAALASLAQIVAAPELLDLTDPVVLRTVIEAGLPDLAEQQIGALVDGVQDVNETIAQASDLGEISAAQGLVFELGNRRDHFTGSDANETVYAGKSRDIVAGEGGDDQLFGEQGNDILSGKSGNDRLDGGRGNDRLSGGADDDLIYGGSGKDSLFGGSGNDQLHGGSGRDLLVGGTGDDIMTGGAGRDIFFIDSDSGADVITDFNRQRDTIAFDADSGVAGFDDLAFEDTGDGVVISWGGEDTLVLAGIAVDAMTERLFTFEEIFA